MEFESAFAVNAPAAQVYDALLDFERVVVCMPGAEACSRRPGSHTASVSR